MKKPIVCGRCGCELSYKEQTELPGRLCFVCDRNQEDRRRQNARKGLES